MDPVLRGALAQGLLDSCNVADGPVLETLSEGSMRGYIASRPTHAAKLEKSINATGLLVGADRRAFKEEMMEVITSGEGPSTGAVAGSGAFLLPRPNVDMVAAGAMMIACERLEPLYTSMGVTRVDAKAYPHQRTS
jgi:hypothetical protein